MVKYIHEAFSDKEHKQLQEKKEEARKQHGLKKLTWHRFILVSTKIKSIDSEL